MGDFRSAKEKTLQEFVEMAKATLEDRPVSLLVQGLEQYYRYRFEHVVYLCARYVKYSENGSSVFIKICENTWVQFSKFRFAFETPE